MITKRRNNMSSRSNIDTRKHQQSHHIPQQTLQQLSTGRHACHPLPTSHARQHAWATICGNEAWLHHERTIPRRYNRPGRKERHFRAPPHPASWATKQAWCKQLCAPHWKTLTAWLADSCLAPGTVRQAALLWSGAHHQALLMHSQTPVQPPLLMRRPRLALPGSHSPHLRRALLRGQLAPAPQPVRVPPRGSPTGPPPVGLRRPAGGRRPPRAWRLPTRLSWAPPVT